MRKLLIFAVVATFGLGVASLASAVERSRATRGWVTAVDTTAKTLKVKGRNDLVTFKLEDNAKVIDKGKTVSLAEVKPGEHVMIRYTGLGLNREATEVDVLASASMQPKTSMSPKAPATKK